MRPRPTSLLPLLALAAAALAACGDDGGGSPDASPVDAQAGGPDAGPTLTETRTLTLLGGRFAEAEIVAGPGDAVRVVLTAPRADIAWNIHGHADGGTQIVVEEDGVMEVDYLFEPTSQSDWYVMPGNRGTQALTIEVTLELYGGATFNGWL